MPGSRIDFGTPTPPGTSPVPDTHAPLHVLSGPEGWLLHVEGFDTPAAVYPTKRAAMKAARELRTAKGCVLIEHGVDGRIR